jgi:hypothetical protein
MGSSEFYDTAQVCLNGHPTNSSADTYPQFNQKFCDRCGAPTITACERCNVPIRGRYNSLGSLDLTPYVPPSFCHNCGKPYPWTEAKLNAARELADELDQLTVSEKETLKSLGDIIRDTTRTQVAATRFKKLMVKAGAQAAGVFRDLIVDIASETAKKAIWPSP